jgi:hypothetical protein
MSNESKRQENNSIRKIRTALDNLNQLSKIKDEVVEKTPELAEVDKFQDKNNLEVIEDSEFAELCEQVAALQFSGETKDSICKVLAITSYKYKEIVLSEDFSSIKRRIAEDQKTNILSKVLKQVDQAITALEDLTATADEDKTRLNAAALVLEYAARLLEEQKTSSPSFNGALRDAAAGAVASGGTVTLQQMIIAQRTARGLNS